MALPPHLSNWYFLTRTYLYIVKRLHRETVCRLAPRLRGRLLDVGCGTSPYRSIFGHATYMGLDFSISRRPAAVADAQYLPIITASMDSVLCTEVLEHVLNPDQVVSEIGRVLIGGGYLLVTAPMSWNLHYEPYDFRRFTCYGLWRVLEQHGFEVIETHRIGGLFSLIGSRLVDGIASELWRRWKRLPPRIRHGLILCYSVPMSLVFTLLSKLLDNFESSDAIAWAVLAKKRC